MAFSQVDRFNGFDMFNGGLKGSRGTGAGWAGGGTVLAGGGL